MTDNTMGIHVVGLEVSNLHRIRVANVRLLPGGGLVRVTGANGSGKTSLLRAIRAALGGAGEVLPAAVNEAAEDGAGSVRLELSNGFTVTRRFTEAAPKGYLTVVGPDGGKHQQGRLNAWLGEHHDFDVLAFFDLPPARQREILLGLGHDPELAQRLDELKAQRKALYDERTPHISEQRRARAVSKPDGERPEPVDVSAELQRMGELQAAERERQDAARTVGDLDEELDANAASISGNQVRVAELVRQLEEARARGSELREEREKLRRRRTEAEEYFSGLPDPTAEMDEVRDRMQAADAIREALEPWKAWERAQEIYGTSTDEVARLTDEMEALAARERQLIAEAGIPVPGLSFEPETAEPLLDGRPLVVASGAERIRMAVHVALAVNPELRVCLVDEANDLDLDALQELERLAKEHAFQVFACRIGLEGPGEILVDDGEARSIEPVAAK